MKLINSFLLVLIFSGNNNLFATKTLPDLNAPINTKNSLFVVGLITGVTAALTGYQGISLIRRYYLPSESELEESLVSYIGRVERRYPKILEAFANEKLDSFDYLSLIERSKKLSENDLERIFHAVPNYDGLPIISDNIIQKSETNTSLNKYAELVNKYRKIGVLLSHTFRYHDAFFEMSKALQDLRSNYPHELDLAKENDNLIMQIENSVFTDFSLVSFKARFDAKTKQLLSCTKLKELEKYPKLKKSVDDTFEEIDLINQALRNSEKYKKEIMMKIEFAKKSDELLLINKRLTIKKKKSELEQLKVLKV